MSHAPDTVQLLTSSGPAAIAVLRIRGPGVPAFLSRCVVPPRARPGAKLVVGQVLRAELRGAAGTSIDDILVSVHAGGPDWEVRLHLHGSPWIVRHTLDLAVAAGFQEIPSDGAALWTSRDALEAEVLALLPAMPSLRGATWLAHHADRLRAAVREASASFADPGGGERARAICRDWSARTPVVEWFSHPLRIALVGPPNGGKSTLINALADQPIALTSPTPGTTRDWLEVHALEDGYPVTWIDTAGLRPAGDPLEAAGMDHTRAWLEQADAVVVVLDASPPASATRGVFVAQAAGFVAPACVALNKSDLPGVDGRVLAELPRNWRNRAVLISAAARSGIHDIYGIVTASQGRTPGQLTGAGCFTARQEQLFKAAAAAPGDESLLLLSQILTV